jgi:YgiT-type zinc finger domain-containing protein
MRKKTKKEPNLKCAICGEQAAHVVLTPKVFGRGEKMVLIEDIPVINCRNCGSQYVDGPTMDAIDAIRKNPKAYSVRRTLDAARIVA